jgi:hypothetical protein
MSDPTRLLHGESDADALERALLRSLHESAPSAADKAAIWQNVSAGIVAAGIVGSSVGVAASAGTLASTAVSTSGASAELTAAGSVALSAGSKGLLVKLGLLAVLGGASVGGVALYRQHLAPVTNSATTAAHESPRRATSAPPVRVQAAPTAEAVRAELPVKTNACRGADCRAIAPKRVAPLRSERAVPDQLARESALLTEARAALRSGDRIGCEKALAQLTRAFPHGVLVQEREVLEIELSLARGENAEARVRAARFVAQHPESPHSEKLERLLR